MNRKPAARWGVLMAVMLLGQPAAAWARTDAHEQLLDLDEKHKRQKRKLEDDLAAEQRRWKDQAARELRDFNEEFKDRKRALAGKIHREGRELKSASQLKKLELQAQAREERETLKAKLQAQQETPEDQRP